MTVSEASVKLGVCHEAVRKMIRTGRLAATPTTENGNWRYDIEPDSLNKFLDTHVFIEGERGVRWVKTG